MVFFSFGLVWTGLLPFEMLRPAEVSVDEWTHLSVSPLVNGLEPCIVPEEHHGDLMVCLLAATCCDLPALHEHCRSLIPEIRQIHAVAAMFQAASFQDPRGMAALVRPQLYTL